MSLFSSLVQGAGRNLFVRDLGGSAGRTMRRLAVIAAVPGVGAWTAHAQECAPVEAAVLLAADGAAGDSFGFSVSIDGDTAIAGALNDRDSGVQSGSVYIYQYSEGAWSEQDKLRPLDGRNQDEFGYSVSISGDTAIVGAYSHTADGLFDSGAAYVFTRSGEVWTQQAKLLPGDAAPDDVFGWAVAVDGDTAVVGAVGADSIGSNTGAAYVFTRTGGVWTEQAKLSPDTWTLNGMFGFAVAVEGDTVGVGMPRAGDIATRAGAAYVFTRSGGVWTQQAKLLASDAELRDEFGFSVALSGDTMLIGARDDDNDNGSRAGSAYIFTRSGGTWTEHTKLLASDGTAGNFFGDAVALAGDVALVGARNGSGSGAAYVFTRSEGAWTEQAKLLPSDGESSDFFGDAVAVSGQTAVAGAYGNDDFGSSSGSAYIFDLGCASCAADFNGDGVVNTQDFIAFLSAWSAGDPLADWNDDGEINTQDFIAFLADWAAGCP